ncbi:penicillin-binding protein 2 [Rhodobacteraceae bacterium NNCM2]|nr:penicillin-binding protein 2 [Coraliihabitans acroporae]
MLMIFAFLVAYGVAGARMGMLALNEPEEPQIARGDKSADPVRGEIHDRNGVLLAGNLPGWSLYADPRFVIEPKQTAEKLAKILTDVPREKIEKLLTKDSRFVWVKRPITPRQRQAVLELGNPGLMFAAREVRVYPSGRLASHVLGGVKTENEGVTFAEQVGNAGIEHYENERLSDPSRLSEPLQLSIDSAAQMTVEEVLATGVNYFGAKGGTGILMDVRTGEMLAMASLPDFNPNLARQPFTGEASYNPRFNRAAQGLYELGSTFKVITATIALELGIVDSDTMIDTATPVTYGRNRFRDHGRIRQQQSVTDIVVRSSNVGSIRMALGIGTRRFKAWLKKLGMFDATTLELSEARQARPRYPSNWTDLTTITASFGHGLSVSPVHLASAYATIANEGRLTRPTLIKGGNPPGEQIFSPRTSRRMMRILREVVSRGTAIRGDVPGYEIGGKTGTAEKFKPEGGYYHDRVISTFAGVFPTSKPRYVIVVSLDEPTDPDSGKREASRTAVPVAGEIVRRVAPLLGLKPLAGTPPKRGYTVPVGLPAELID